MCKVVSLVAYVYTKFRLNIDNFAIIRLTLPRILLGFNKCAVFVLCVPTVEAVYCYISLLLVSSDLNSDEPLNLNYTLPHILFGCTNPSDNSSLLRLCTYLGIQIENNE